MIYRIILCSLLSTWAFHAVNAQDTLITYFTKNWIKTDVQEDAHYYRKSFEMDSKWSIKDYNKDHSILCTGRYMTNKEKKKDGEWHYYFKKGNISQIITFQKGKENGPFKSYYENEALLSKGIYEKGKRIGEWTWYHKNGQESSVEQYKRGKVKSFKFYNTEGSEVPGNDVIKLPQYGSGQEELLLVLRYSLKYPEEAIKKGIEGQVFVTFIIDESGNMINPHISKSVHPLLDEEALRVVSYLKKWEPASRHNLITPVNYTIPVRFRLIDPDFSNFQFFQLNDAQVIPSHSNRFRPLLRGM